jgi:hypothetical protein
MIYNNYFSQRNGFKPADNIVIRNAMPVEVQNAIANCFDKLWQCLDYRSNQSYVISDITHIDFEREIWIHFLNRRNDEFSGYRRYKCASSEIINGNEYAWYQKLDLVEFVLRYFNDLVKSVKEHTFAKLRTDFAKILNFEFERLNYGYRVVGTEIIEITSDAEIDTINKAVEGSKDNVKEHLKKAIAHYAARPNPDVRNSIKESISAVETVCRELTGESTLGADLKKLESKGIKVQNQLRTAFTQLYAYTNNPDTGIRHALMDDTCDYVPTPAEAYYMLVSCSAFINYLRMKVAARK